MQSIMVSTLTPVVRMEEGCSGGSLVKNFILHIFVRSGILGSSIASASGAALGEGRYLAFPCASDWNSTK